MVGVESAYDFDTYQLMASEKQKHTQLKLLMNFFCQTKNINKQQFFNKNKNTFQNKHR